MRQQAAIAVQYFQMVENLDEEQKRLFTVLVRHTVSNPYARYYLRAYGLSVTGVREGLRRLVADGVVVRGTDGVWRVDPPELAAWWKTLGDDPGRADCRRLAVNGFGG